MTDDESTKSLKGKVAIITGAARGQGAAEARLFVREGARVVMTDVLDDEGKALADELGAMAEYRRHDVTDEQSWNELVSYVESAYGAVDVLVNNAGIYRVSPLTETTTEDYDAMYRVNQRSVFFGMRAVVPAMRRAGKGSIVNTASAAALRGSPGIVAYAATKFAVRGMTKVAALELGEHNIRVNAIHPGLIDTAMLAENSEETMVMLRGMVPMKRLGESAEVAKVAAFLASDAASYVSGGDFTVDGALTG